jgi:hypothetical protein
MCPMYPVMSAPQRIGYRHAMTRPLFRVAIVDRSLLLAAGVAAFAFLYRLLIIDFDNDNFGR